MGLDIERLEELELQMSTIMAVVTVLTKAILKADRSTHTLLTDQNRYYLLEALGEFNDYMIKLKQQTNEEIRRIKKVLKK